VWAGVDSAWEQEKLEARKMLENAAESHTSGAPRTWAGAHSQRKEPGCGAFRMCPRAGSLGRFVGQARLVQDSLTEKRPHQQLD